MEYNPQDTAITVQYTFYGLVAQLVEHDTFNVGVLGSSPSGVTPKNDSIAQLVRAVPVKRDVSQVRVLLGSREKR